MLISAEHRTESLICIKINDILTNLDNLYTNDQFKKSKFRIFLENKLKMQINKT